MRTTEKVQGAANKKINRSEKLQKKQNWQKMRKCSESGTCIDQLSQDFVSNSENETLA